MSDIVLCDPEDKFKLISFIDKNWKKNHALVKSSELLYFQHYNKFDNIYNFIIAKNKINSDIDAILGFIPTFHYDNNLRENGDYWGAIWKKKENVPDSTSKTIGLDILLKLLENPNCKSFAAIGISKIAKRLYIALGMRSGFLSQYYILNPYIKNYKIAKNVDLSELNNLDSCSSNSIRIINKKELKQIKLEYHYKPQKSIEYFINRYVKHPIYNYDFLGIYSEEELIAIWVIRSIVINGSSVIRVIDVLGNLDKVTNIKSLIIGFLKSQKAEYLDFLNFGIPADTFQKMGFEKLNIEDELILPNYFEPFEHRNIKIELAYKADFDYVVFKGDADQDRPNLINSI